MSKTLARSAPELLPAGVRLISLTPHRDDRGSLTEIFRRSWEQVSVAIQWNLIRTEAGVLRGVHFHPRHVDYLVPLEGHVSIGLADLRRGSPTERLGVLIDIQPNDSVGLLVPNGVGHGILAHERSTIVYGASRYWDPTDDIDVRWDDSALGIPWPVTNPKLSERDAIAPPLSQIQDLLIRYST